jgi:MFS family permease
VSSIPGEQPPSPRFKSIAALSYRDFRYLWFGVIAYMAGMQMQGVGRGYLVYDITSSPILLGLVNTGFAVPMLVLTLFGGVVADRFPKKRIIQFCQCFGAVTALLIGVAISTGVITWVHVFMSSVVNGMVFAFIVPSRTALIPSLVSEENSSNAFAMNAAAMSTTTLLAPAIAGNLYNWIGADGLYYCIGGCQLLAAVFTGLIAGKERPTKKTVHASVLKEIKLGFQYIGKDKLIVILIVISAVTTLLSMPFRSLLPIYIVDVFHRGPEILGLLLSVMGVGAIAGSVFVASIGRRKRGLILILGGFLSGAGLIFAGFVPFISVVSVSLFFLGVGDAFRRALSMALIMELTEPEYQGRVSSVYAANFGLMPLGVFPASIISEYFGVQAAAATLGIVLLGLCVFITAKRKDLRRMD